MADGRRERRVGIFGRTESFDLKMEYDNLHNIRRKTQDHFRGTTVLADGTCDFEYGYAGGQPHAPSKIGRRKYVYDANGNSSGWETEGHFSWRKMLWDEENRLTAISDNGFVVQNTYDASGERAIKSSGGGQSLFQNGTPVGFVQHNKNYTAYVSPQLVVREGSFTKHIFVEGGRIASKTGTGYFSNKFHFNKGLTAGGLDFSKRANLLQAAVTGQFAALNVPPGAPGLHGLLNSPEITGVPTAVLNLPDSVYRVVAAGLGFVATAKRQHPGCPGLSDRHGDDRRKRAGRSWF